MTLKVAAQVFWVDESEGHDDDDDDVDGLKKCEMSLPFFDFNMRSLVLTTNRYSKEALQDHTHLPQRLQA